jgi:hypothetical protein
LIDIGRIVDHHCLNFLFITFPVDSEAITYMKANFE